MKVLLTLKHLINFFFFLFLVLAVLWMIPPLYGALGHDFIAVIKEILTNGAGTIERAEGAYYWYLLIWFSFHIIMFFMIIYYLRRFVLESIVQGAFDRGTRKYLRLAGILFVIYGVVRIPSNLIAPLFFYWSGGENYLSFITMDLMGFDSPLFMTLIGLFFIYIAKTLELSEMLQEENRLTI